MRKLILLSGILTFSLLLAADAAAQYRFPRPGGYQPRPRPAQARMAQMEMDDATSELDFHLSVAQIDGGLILGARYTHKVTDLIGVEGGFDHDHGSRRYGEKLLGYGGIRWKLSGSSSFSSAYLTAGVAAGGGYSFALTPYVGFSARGSCSEPLCIRYDMTFFPAVEKITERFRGSVGFSVSLR
jgi:hypothetical protein